MKINTSVLHNLSKEKYLAYIHSLPSFKEEKMQSYATLILTLFAISLFGMFAIAPTLTTIVSLRKTLADNVFLNEQLQTKISAMSKLQQAYSQLSPQLPLLYAAVPKTPESSKLTGKIRAVAVKSGVTLIQLRINSINVATAKKVPSALTPIQLTIAVKGQPSDLKTFADSLSSIDRLITITALNYSTLKTQTGITNQLTLQANAYYRP